MRRSTIKDVSQRAGVSVATVSKALNRTSSVSEATRQRVISAADELDYRPNRAAQGLVGQRSFLVGYSLPAIGSWGNPILDAFLHAMVASAAGHGLQVVLFQGDRDDDPTAGYEEMIRRGAVDGFVLTETDYDDPRIDSLLERAFPFVTFGRTDRGSEHFCVDVDGASGTDQAVRHLAALGHERFGLIAWPERSETGDLRVRGATEALEQLGLAEPVIVRATNSIENGRQAFAELMNTDNRCTAVVAVQDDLALGAHAAAIEMGRRVGQDIAIVGFDDIPATSVVSPPLTSIRQPFGEVGAALVEMLVALLTDPDITPTGRLITPELIVRSSSGVAR